MIIWTVWFSILATSVNTIQSSDCRMIFIFCKGFSVVDIIACNSVFIAMSWWLSCTTPMKWFWMKILKNFFQTFTSRPTLMVLMMYRKLMCIMGNKTVCSHGYFFGYWVVAILGAVYCVLFALLVYNMLLLLLVLKQVKVTLTGSLDCLSYTTQLNKALKHQTRSVLHSVLLSSHL